jgi:hypothetical protein
MNELAKVNPTLINSVKDLEDIALVFVKSGFFQDTADLAKAQVKIMAGREIGLEAFASMTGIHVIKGKVTYGANVQAAKVKNSGRYDYRVREMSEKACRIMFYQLVSGKWEEIGQSDFTIEDARRAGTQNLDKFTRNMLFARAMSNGVKWYCPDVTSGVTMYAPEEFGAVVDDSGQVVEVDEKAKQDAPQVVDGQVLSTATEEPATAARFDAETLRKKINTTITAAALDGKTTCTDGDRKVLAAALGKIFKDATTRYEFSAYLAGEASTKKMTPEAVYALLKWLGNGNAQAVNFDYAPPAFIVAEANAVHTAALIAAGQQPLI